MNLQKGDPAPAISVSDVYGKAVKLSDFKGKKILLTFFRTAGCPVCNVRFHELQKQESYFASRGLVFLAVYNSQRDNMLNYIKSVYGGSKPYPIFITDPDKAIYGQYGVGESMGKLLKGLLFKGGFGVFKEGTALFKQSPIKIKDDGSLSLVSSDFLIDEKGVIVNAHYGDYAGDFLDMGIIREFIK